MDLTQIGCITKEHAELQELIPLQGTLKELSKENFAKLESSIEEFGFTVPFFIWKDPDNNNQLTLLDGHQRRLFLLHKRDKEGWNIPKLPIVEILAKDIDEAKKKLLVVTSSYGKMTDEGLYEFIEDTTINMDFLNEHVELEGIDLKLFDAEFFKDTLAKVNKGDENDEWAALGMPEFEQGDERFTVVFNFKSELSRNSFVEKERIDIDAKRTKCWICYKDGR